MAAAKSLVIESANASVNPGELVIDYTVANPFSITLASEIDLNYGQGQGGTVPTLGPGESQDATFTAQIDVSGSSETIDWSVCTNLGCESGITTVPAEGSDNGNGGTNSPSVQITSTSVDPGDGGITLNLSWQNTDEIVVNLLKNGQHVDTKGMNTLPSGSGPITVYADSAGNFTVDVVASNDSGTTTKTTTVDTEAQPLTVTIDSINKSGNEISPEATVTEGTGDAGTLKDFHWEVSEAVTGKMVATDDSMDATFTFQEHGTYTIHAFATDGNSNIHTSSATITIKKEDIPGNGNGQNGDGAGTNLKAAAIGVAAIGGGLALYEMSGSDNTNRERTR